jgi:hypothetical protein
MADARIRRQIALLAARLMYERTESEYFTAKRKAARQLGVEYRFRPKDLPSNSEIRDEVQRLAELMEGERRRDKLRDMRLSALRLMRTLAAFRPRLIGSVLTGHIRQGSDIDLHVFTDHPSSLTSLFEDEGIDCEVERKLVRKHGEERVFTHIHLVHGGFEFELTVYDLSKVNYAFKSSITGKAIERASIAELEQLLLREYPGLDLSNEALDYDEESAGEERWETYRRLLLPLEKVEQSPKHHPEGDALYHSLQVFELARDRVPYDEEFLLAALLHDVGKAVDASDHTRAGLEALEGMVTERTAWLIEHHMAAHELYAGTLGHRARQRLQESPDYDDLILLGELDRAGRRTGVRVCTVDEALEFIRAVAGED